MQSLPSLMFDRVLNIACVLDMPGFSIFLCYWICKGCEYTRVLNMPVFWIDQGSEYASGSGYIGVLNMARLCRVLDMPKYVWIVYEYVGIYMNMPKFAWITFALRFPILTPCLHGCVVTYFNFYMKVEVIVWRNKRLFWKRVNLFFFIIAEVFDLFLFFFVLD